MPHFLTPLLHSNDPRFCLRIAGTGRVLADRVETAFDSTSRRKGLMGRDGMAPGSALIIAPSNSVHTFFMRFPIDVVYADRQGRVLKVRHAMPAWRLSGSIGAFAVIELPAGAARQVGLTAGDLLEVAQEKGEGKREKGKG